MFSIINSISINLDWGIAQRVQIRIRIYPFEERGKLPVCDTIRLCFSKGFVSKQYLSAYAERRIMKGVLNEQRYKVES
jgi:hypothetical protein